jgi:hypothetical protein
VCFLNEQSFSAGTFVRDHGLDGKQLRTKISGVPRETIVCPIDLYEAEPYDVIKHVKRSHFPGHKTDNEVRKRSGDFYGAIQR